MRAQQEPLKNMKWLTDSLMNRRHHRVKNEHRKGMKNHASDTKTIIIA